MVNEQKYAAYVKELGSMMVEKRNRLTGRKHYETKARISATMRGVPHELLTRDQ